MKPVALTLAIALAAACTKGEHREAREKYNEGVAQLQKGEHEAAEKALLDARSSAGVDPELRFRAAYDLGMAYAAHAEKMKTGKDADLSKALELAQQAVSWFSDAARLKKDDADTAANLAIVRARVQALSDELRRGEGKLEARLDAVIGEQRSVLDDARGAWLAVKQAGGADPLAQQATLTHLADKERGIVAEAGVITDLASDEIDEIGKKAEDKRTDEEKVRVIQLKNLDLYLLDGRGKIAEARRKLQDLAAEDAVAKAEAALIALKRAREQLLDPITVLREVAQDEVVLAQETQAVAELGGGKHLLDAPKPAASPALPAWVGPTAMAERQGGLRDRVEEVRARLAAGVETPPPADKPPSEDQQKLLDRVKTALPFVVEASAAMDRARGALGDNGLPEAREAERDALIALAKAIEQFADLKQTIDLASETQKQLVQLLSPESAKQLPAAERASATREALAANLVRMPRIAELLADEVQKLDKQAAQPAQPAPQGQPAPDPEARKKQIEAMKAQLAEAETLRADAAKALGQLDGAIKANKDPLTPAKDADAKLDELRRIFFSVIEHLQDLIRRQGETKDRTSAVNMENDDVRAPTLPELSTREDEHGRLAKGITDALAKQADAAGKAQDPNAAQQAKTMSAAAAEVRLAQNDMSDAKATLDKAIKTTNQSIALKPSVDSQGKAIEHLEAALKLLQPPQQQKDQKDQKDQKQPQPQPKQDKDKQPQQPQGGAGQRARDEDARRQKQKRDKEATEDTVDKDW